jgi:feruloyl esterase
VVFADATAEDAQAVHYPFTIAQYQRAIQRHGLNDATNPDLRPFANHGGKLILWHGWSDDSIAPMISIAYYRAVQKEIGVETADRFVRLFMIPGVGHCGGGDGFSQIDTLTPLMAWVERGHAPAEIVADKVAAASGGPGMGPGPDGRGGKAQSAPYAREKQAAVSSRPIYPFPAIARYSGSGDPAKDSSYIASPSPASDTNVLDWYGAELLRPGFQMNFTVSNGKLTTTGPAAAQ